MIKTTIDLSGPFFRADPAKTFRANVRVLMDAIAAEGEADVRAQLRAGEGRRRPLAVGGGRVSATVRGRTRALTGKRWAVTAVVSPSTTGMGRAQAISTMAAASQIESQIHAVRKTAGRLRRARAINRIELTKGL